MKSLKLLIINALTLIIGLGLMSGSVSQRNAEAARFEAIPSIQVNRLGNLRGQYLTVLYAVGSRPFISTDASQITISQVKESRTVYISADSMSLPKVQVEKEGFRPSYNIVIFVVSPQPNYSWVNADGSAPQGMTLTNNHQISLMNSINKTDVDDFISAQGEEAILNVNLVK
ncbi:hypothetical protein AZI86_18835 [Bdellovibrio bacteriovorus]|uniref:Uncharacterized protein n=1 Tax=Bdellovibrio bacteriovorus TaxID=959 RepID=A0A150WDJ6_BDEBC|nr:hypothetical protein [Bdellovibrio bacteriovorus]KYG60971.1 hypothetical protein AZI86_18835 [Bdellovibrio bacteriovorus]